MSGGSILIMNNVLNNLIIYNGYPLSVVVALSIHTVLFVFILYIQSSSEADTLELVQPTIIKALLIDENPQVVNQRNLERQHIEQQRQRELERERQRQAEAEREAERQERERQQQDAERQRIAEERRVSEIREREELEHQKREEQRRREQERREEELRRQAEQAEQERQRQQALERQQAEAARNEFELVQSATGLIQQIVQENWSRPPSARNGMRTILQIGMLPTGELLDVTITQSSGDAAFDRSAETAVYRAAPFSELQSLPINVFNANFRSLSLIFEPEDLLN